MNRNLRVLGVVALLVLGGIAAFLASRNGGNIFNVFQNVTNQIINNSYFTQLIADGVTTKEDLQAIAEIRPYGEGFIGVSKAALDWERAQDLAKRTGSRILRVDRAGIESREELVTWLETTFDSHLSSPVWALDQWRPSVLVSSEILTVKETDSERRALLHWRPLAPALAAATKDEPYVNSLGMKFVPVPGTKVLFCIHETRRKDFAAYAEEVSTVNQTWVGHNGYTIPPAEKPDHPVFYVSRNDSQAFCKWLSKKEGATYRLPTDREWSEAVGIGEEELIDTPEQLSEKVTGRYPWGNFWPPLHNSENYADRTYATKYAKAPIIEGYDDGYIVTAPVMRFLPNQLGLYDLGGNVGEWCSDSWNPTSSDGVFRGGSWRRAKQQELLSSRRNRWTPNGRGISTGFRVVLELQGGTSDASETSSLSN